MTDEQREQDRHREPEAQDDQRQADPAEAGDDAPATGVVPPRRGAGIAWLALLLALVTAGGGGWWYWQNEQRLQSLQQQLQEVREAATAEKPAAVPTGLSPEAEQAIDQLEQAVDSDLRALGQRMRQQLGELQPQLRNQSEQLRSVEQQLQEQRDALGEITGSDRDGWLLAEVEYLLRLANQRLLMTGDVDSARALLASADRVLRQLDDSSLHGVRQAVAADRAALRGVSRIDVEGLYLRLAALVDQIRGLEFLALPERSESSPAREAETSWQDRLRLGYQQALAKLSDYIAIRRREAPVEAFMDPQLEDLMRQNTTMLLQQAQIALLSGNQRLYQESLQRTRRWISEFFQVKEQVAESMLEEIDDLAGQVVAVDLPDLDASLQALEAARDQRLLRREEE